MTFPLRERPTPSYHERPRAFGSPRDGGARPHAGCDLSAPPGTEILAVEAGTVTRGCYTFYDEVFALEILHLETYDGTGQGPLTDRARPPLMRRADLTDPTALLDSCTEVTSHAAV
jgi:hypothetical protein